MNWWWDWKVFLSSCLFWPAFPSFKIWSKVWINGRKDGFSKTLIYHLSWCIGLFPFSKISSMEDDGFETFSFFCNCWWQPFPLPKSLLWVVQGLKSELVIQLISLSNDKEDSKFNMSHILSLKIMKSPLLNLTHWGPSNNTKIAP